MLLVQVGVMTVPIHQNSILIHSLLFLWITKVSELVSASSDKFDNGTEGGPNANKKRRKREKSSN